MAHQELYTNCFALVCFRGSEPVAEETVRFIRETGGVSVLAHPWALKNHSAIVRRLKDAGLHGIEAYRSDGKLSGRCFSFLFCFMDRGCYYKNLGPFFLLAYHFTFLLHQLRLFCVLKLFS